MLEPIIEGMKRKTTNMGMNIQPDQAIELLLLIIIEKKMKTRP